jgi:DNA-binding XRE family transcriptional regulator
MSGRRFESIHVKDAGFTPEQREQMRRAAQAFQDDKLAIDELVASGKYSEAMPWGVLLDSLFAVAELKKTREAMGLSLTDVSERSGIDRATLCKIENGKGNPTIQTIGRYAAALGKRVTIVLEDLAPNETIDTNSPAMA